MILKKVNGKAIKDAKLKAIADMFYGKVGTKLNLELVKPDTGENVRVKLVHKKYHK